MGNLQNGNSPEGESQEGESQEGVFSRRGILLNGNSPEDEFCRTEYDGMKRGGAEEEEEMCI
jgi:hypothetical protein